MLIKSPFLRYKYSPDKNNVFVYHSLFGNPRIFNEVGFRLLDLFSNAKSCNELSYQLEGDAKPLIDELREIHFLVPPNEDERVLLSMKRNELLARIAKGESFDHISLSVSDNCNFGCKHCMFYQADYKGMPLPVYQRSAPDLIMSWPTAKACLDLYLGYLRNRQSWNARIHFGNAEPLLNWAVIAQTFDYCGKQKEFNFEYSINTNLSLLTKEMAETLKRYKVEIATSIDGIGDVNDKIRKTKGGKGTFEIIIAKMDLLESIGYPLDGVSVTVTSENYHAIDTEIIDFASSRGMTSIAFDYDLIGQSSIEIEQRVQKLLRLKNYALTKGIYFGGTWFSPFRTMMTTSMLSRPHAFCAALEGRSLVFNPDGSIKTCGYTTTQIGRLGAISAILQGKGSLLELVRERFPGSNSSCQGCEIEGPCGGQCLATQEVAQRGSPDLFEQMCHFYRTITNALILDYMNALENPNELEQRVRYL